MNQEGTAVHSRRRVLVVVRWPVGGIRTWCRYVYRDPAFRDYDIEIIMPDDPESTALCADLVDTGIKTTICGNSESTRSFVVDVTKRILGENWDMVHSHGFTSGLASAIPCLIKRIPHLVTPHDVILDWQHRDLKGRMARAAIGLMLRSASCVQAVGQSAADNLAMAFPRSIKRTRRLCVVRNGIDSRRFLEEEPVNLRERLAITEEVILVGFFGRFMAQKGFRYLVEAVRQHNYSPQMSVPIVVVAVGGGGFRREEEDAVRSLGISENFRFMDFEPNIAGLVKGVDVIVMPSLWEACGLLAMEALVAGVPLVVSDCEGLVDISRGTPAKVVPMRDPERLLDAMLEMSKPEKKEAAMGFRALAAEMFDVKGTVVGMSKLYNETAGR